MPVRLRVPLLILGFGLLAGPIAAALLADARVARTQRLIAEIQAAEAGLTFNGVRTLTSYEKDVPITTVLRVAGAPPDRRAVELVGVEGSPAAPKGRPQGMNPLTFLVQIQAALAAPGVGRQPGRQDRFGDPALVARNYVLGSLGRDTVAGRAADGFELVPRHAGRARFRLWADAENRFLLRFQVWIDGALSLETSHRSIAFGSAGSADFRGHAAPRWTSMVGLQRDRLQGSDELPVAVKFRAFVARELPDGFVLREMEVVRVTVPGIKAPFEAMHAAYTDGMATVLLLEFDANNKLWKQMQAWMAGMGEAPSPAPAAKKGEIVAERLSGRSGSAIRMTVEGTEVVVAGQVPADELERMVRSLFKVEGR
jgi:hypothetical protein